MKRLLSLLLVVSMISLRLTLGTNALFVDNAQANSLSFGTGCWLKPSIPQLIYPQDNYLAILGSDWLNNPYMDWSDSSSECQSASPFQYQYESYRDQQLNNLAYRSDWLTLSRISAPNSPDGTYYWRVRAKDSKGNISEFSQVWKLIVDRQPTYPTIVINEVLFDVPSGSGLDDKNEWVELYNNSNFPVSLKNWKLQSNSKTYTINRNISIPAKGFAYLSHDATTWGFWDTSDNSVSLNLGGQQVSWLDHVGSLKLLNPAGVEIDYVAWNNFNSWDLISVSGESVRRIVDGVDAYNDWRDWETATPTAKATMSLMSMSFLPPAGLSAQITSKSFGHITLQIANLPQNYSQKTPYTYEIIYNSKFGVEKGAFGTIDPSLVTDGIYRKELILGTCSSGICIPDLAKPANIYLNIFDGTTPIVDNMLFSL